MSILTGASLSEPHTSVTSLHPSCVCLLACIKHFRLLFFVVTSYVKFKNHSIVEDLNHGKSSSSMATTRTETTQGPFSG